ncbi:unnamed protein product [Rotaria socialis]|uniref:Prolyl 4-hydroxylase alpha subunit Fe(2+) 2OG dioxygenase domain-containing protein n=1 Tax=Rotaria socialis TaxID=392032 RepID=A0A821EEI6_9BILA|nr:unnamed protein product [Rotaria socialis]
MNRNYFLGNIDLSITYSLLTNYSVPTKLQNGAELNKIKQQSDLILIGLGTWEMCGINKAMRLNRYHESEYFAPHKDSQYAPSEGETKFYFPKQSPKYSTKGSTIKEEIEDYGGLDDDYECVAIKPRKGHAVLFTHNLLHEGVAPEIRNSSGVKQRIVLRADVVVKRKENHYDLQ